MNPSIASPEHGHILSGSVSRREMGIKKSYDCLLMCQLVPECKSFNFSKKEEVCELNGATKKEFPANFVVRNDYDYYQLVKGIVVIRIGEL